MWIRSRRATQRNFRRRVALYGTSVHGDTPSPKVTDSDTKYFVRRDRPLVAQYPLTRFAWDHRWLRRGSCGVRQFLMTDPGGNCIRIGQPTGESLHHAPAPKEPGARALHNAWMLGISKGEPAQGAKILDRALQRESPASAAEQLRALILRADLADQLGDGELAARLLDDAAGVELTDAERATLRDDLARADDLRESLRD